MSKRHRPQEIKSKLEATESSAHIATTNQVQDYRPNHLLAAATVGIHKSSGARRTRSSSANREQTDWQRDSLLPWNRRSSGIALPSTLRDRNSSDWSSPLQVWRRNHAVFRIKIRTQANVDLETEKCETNDDQIAHRKLLFGGAHFNLFSVLCGDFSESRGMQFKSGILFLHHGCIAKV